MIFINNNIKYNLGKNAKENFILLDNADKEDWWFHLDNYSSAYCIVESKNLNEEMIIFASNLVKNSKKDIKLKDKKVKIIYTQVKNIKKTKTLGMVTILSKPSEIYI
jgi:predicted ribosome quality control (RQC) complex YloA/Tae2 family protein